jgi:hypothetical protein
MMPVNGNFQTSKIHFKNVILEEEDENLKVLNTQTQESILISTSQNIDYKEVFNPTLSGIEFLNTSYYTVYNDTVTLFGHAIIDNNYYNKFVMIQLPLLAKAVASGTVQFRDPNDPDVSTNIGSIFVDDNLFFLILKSNLIDKSVMSKLEVIFTISYIRKKIN